MARNIKDEYFQWLCWMVGTERDGNSYHLLLKALHSHQFAWFVPNDDNRAAEGNALRDRFYRHELIPFSFNSNDFADCECTMLELILGLALRCYSTLEDSPDNILISEWFWKLLANVGLYDYSDEYYHNMGVSDFVGVIMDKITNRTYHSSGKGGLFPLKKSKKDQRKVELWYQMSEYLVENYYTTR